MGEFVSGNIFIREMRFDNDEPVKGHGHNFGHTTYVVVGGLRFEKLDDQDNVIRTVDKWAKDGLNWVLIEQGVRHRITPLVLQSKGGSLGHCIYSHRLPQSLVDLQGRDEEYDAQLAKLIEMANTRFGQIVQVDTGWQEAYV